LDTLTKRIVILLYVVHWFPKWQHRCCRTSRELCSNYLYVQYFLNIFYAR